MSELFGGDVPTPPPPPPPAPPPPTVDNATKSVEDAEKMRRRKGRAATVLTDEKTQTLGTATTTSGAQLLGS